MNNTQTPVTPSGDYTKILIITVILSIFSVFGTTGNAFVLYVFSRKKEKNTSTIFILTLAMVDFLTCLIVIPFTIVVEYKEKKTNDDVACKIYSFLITCSVPFSAFIMVAIAFDRYFCICRPWTRLLDAKSAKRIIFVLFIFVVGLGMTTALTHGVYTLESETVNRTLKNGSFKSVFNNSRVEMDNHRYVEILPNDSTAQQYWGYKGNDQHNITKTITITRQIYTGICLPNEILIGVGVRKVYQTFYISLFVIAFVSVSVLYALIYRSILVRRKRRLEASGIHKFFSQRKQTYITSVATGRGTEITERTCDEDPVKEEETLATVDECNEQSDKQDADNTTDDQPADNDIPLDTFRTTEGIHDDTAQNNGHTSGKVRSKRKKQTDHKLRGGKNCHVRVKELNEASKLTSADMSSVNTNCYTENEGPEAAKSVTVYRQDTRKSVRERHRIANIKTAGILFTVTLVFILAFLPAWLMATKFISADIVVFYMYFSYNVANPIIYAFFNNTFQKEVKNALRCKR